MQGRPLLLEGYPDPMQRYPLSFILCAVLGLLCVVPGAVSMAGFGAALHPLLADEGAGLALIVSAIALFGSGAFPLVIARLRMNDSQASQ